MRRGELAALLELKLSPGLGEIRLRRVLQRYPSAQEALRAYLRNPRESFATRPQREAPGELFRELNKRRDGVPVDSGERSLRQSRVATALRAIELERIRVLVERDRAYPPQLLHLHDPPPVLFARGDLELLREPIVAVVGSRNNTEYGASTARVVAGGLASAGLVVVSGLARGIDRIAHEAAFEAGGRTIAVLGNGVDVVYPPEHGRLQERIAEEGLLLSEFVPGEPPAPHNFPQRNRILAALSHCVIIVEASRSSGALNTAKHAIDLSREVFAVPGPIGRDTSTGTNELIRDGAGMLTCVTDVLEQLARLKPPIRLRPPVTSGGAGTRRPEHSQWPTERAAGSEGSWNADAPPAGRVQRAVWSVIGPESVQLDDIAARSGVTPAEALIALLELELDGRVRQLVGMRFARTPA